MIISLLIVYLKFTESTYVLCQNMVNIDFDYEEGNLFKKEDKDKTKTRKSFKYSEKFSDLKPEKFSTLYSICNDHYTDYSKHTLTNYTLNMMINALYKGKLNLEYDEDVRKFKDEFENTSMKGFKFNLYVIKVIHFFIYITILYFLVVEFTDCLINMIFGVLNKILIIIFIIFVIDGGIKLFLNMNIDSVNMFEHYNSVIFTPIKLGYSIFKRVYGFF